MAWSEKLPSGKYRGVYRDGAGKARSAGTFTHKAKAEREAGAKEVSARKKLWSDPEAYRKPWGQWADEWEKGRSVEDSTKARDRNRRATHLDPRWKDAPIGSITRHDVKKWASELGQRPGTGPSTVQRAVHLLSASLEAAVDAEIIEHNPAWRIKLPKGEQAGERFLTLDEYNLIRSKLPTTFDQLVTDMLVRTGVRWGELAGLHWSRVDLERRSIQVVETFTEAGNRMKPYPKGRRVRVVPLTDELVDDLRERLESAGDIGTCGREHVAGRCRSGLVFTTPTGAPLRNSNWAPTFRDAVDRAKVGHVRPYDLRHTYASWLLQSGIPLAEVGHLMGHVSTQTTAIYAHLAAEPSDAVRLALAAPILPHGAGAK